MNQKSIFLSPKERQEKLDNQTPYERITFRLRMIKVCIMLKNAKIIHSEIQPKK